MMNSLCESDRRGDKYLEPVRKIVCNAPQVVSLEVTTRCQLDCIYCTRDKENPEDFLLEHLEQLLEHLEGVRNLIICGMGESFCYKDIYELIWSLRDYKVSIITNGAVLIDFEKLNQEGNVELLVFSIDATTKEKMDVIAKNYNFDVLKKNLSNLKRYPNIVGIINSTMNESNLDEITNLVEFAALHGLQAISYGLPIGEEEFISENKEKIKSLITEAVQLANKKHIIINQPYRLSCNTKGSIVPNIRLDGEVYPCCNGMNQNEAIGNLYKQSLQKLWTEYATPLLTSDFCKECKLLNNLLRIAE